MKPLINQIAVMTLVLLIAPGATRAGDVYVETNLVSNGTVPAQKIDPNLQGAWGLSFSATGPFWVSNQASNTSTLYSVNPTTNQTSIIPLVVGVPNQGGVSANPNENGPTGQVAIGAAGISTGSTDFLLGAKQAAFAFANMDGSISAWNAGKGATIETTVAGASFTGLAIGNASAGPQLYAADQNSGKIDVFNSKWQMTGSFSDPNFSKFPTGYTAFNVQNLSVNGTQTLFVTYANQATGGGIVDEFTTNGTFIKTLISDTAGTHLDAPWGITIAPKGWGQFGGDLLVANDNANSDGLTEINAYNLTTGAFVGTLTLSDGKPFSETELWALSFGNGGSAGSANTLYFTAGLDNNTNGLLGAISVQSVPEPRSAILGLIAISVGGAGMTWKRAPKG